MAVTAIAPSQSLHPNGVPSKRQVSCDSHPNWQTYTFVDVFVRDLPPNVSTLDLYKNFIQHGEISSITIKNNTGGAWKNQAEIRFKPPPKEAFWVESRHDFKDAAGLDTIVGVKLSISQRRNFTVESPIDKDVVYNEEMELHAESLSFGVLINPTTMMLMKTRHSLAQSKVKLILNLKHREIEIRFPSLARGAEKPVYNQFPWFMPEYRFRVSIDQGISIAQIHEPDEKISFVLRVDTPPPYAKKQHEEVLGSHVAEARRWLEDDVWLRQTVIAGQHHNGSGVLTPISLARGEGKLNLGRWKTFRITFREAEMEVNKFRLMTKALRDFNIKISRAKDFKYVPPVLPVWEFLDQHLLSQTTATTSHARELSLLEESVSLPFSVRYLLDVCISSGRLNEYVVREDFLQALNNVGDFKACNRLKLILDMPPNKELADPMSIFDDRKYRPILRKEPKIPDNCALIYSATVTATTIIFHAPSVEITNRIIRRYKQHSDRFLRIRFEDDKYRGNSKIYATTTNKMDAIFQRVRRTLTCGIQIGDRKYEFLAWGNSQLREHGAYFFADLPNVLSASQIRAVMGQFDDEKIIAKRAARMGQCFSTTKPIQLRIPRVTRTSLIDDVVRDKYTFTDGVGQLSPLLARLINDQLKLDDLTPSLFQFRLGGCKGVLVVAEALKGVDMRLRNSQFKFASESNDLEIIRCSRFEGAHLNRQLILVLSALGVDDSVFLSMQEKEIRELDEAMDNDAAAGAKLRMTVDANQGTLALADLVDQGFRARNEPFVTSLLQLWRAWSLKYLKEKAKLHVENGATLLGCVDETATLQGHYYNPKPRPNASYQEQFARLPQIFVQMETRESKEHRAKQKREGQKLDAPVYRAKEGVCLIARNPSLHEGDIRVVRAINVPALSHLRDVLVLPQTGDRDLASMCSGGDLDGDDYLVIWAEDPQAAKFDLLPKIWNAEPMDYMAPPPVRAKGDVTQNDIIQFFDQYMRNNFLGRIAHAHLSWADYHDEGIRSHECLQLAKLHSQAVDYPKTGRPAKLPRALDRFEWPHFMEKKGGKPYTSRKVLGKLYDKVERVRFVPNYRGKFDDCILNSYEPSEAVRHKVADLKWDYDTSLRRIMAQHEIKTEFEIWSTFVLDHSKAASDYKFHEEIGNLSKSLKEEFEEAIVEAAGGRTFEHLRPYAVASYQLVCNEVFYALEDVRKGEREEVPEQMPFISFPWLLQETLGQLSTAVRRSSEIHTAFQVPDTDSKGYRDSENLFGRQRIGSNHQGEVWADPYQPVTGFADSKETDTIPTATEVDHPKNEPGPELREPIQRVAPTSPKEEQIWSSAPVAPDASNISAVLRKVTSLLDDYEDQDPDTLPQILNRASLAPLHATNQSWKGIDHTFQTPLRQHSSDSDSLARVSNEPSARLSDMVDVASSGYLANLDQHIHSSQNRTSFEPKDAKSLSGDLEGPSFGQRSYIDEDGIYRSKFRRSSGQSVSSLSRRGSRQVSREALVTAATTPPSTGGPSSHTAPLPLLIKPTGPLVEGRDSGVEKIPSESGTPTASAEASFRIEIDSDDGGEVMVYGDPAGM